MPLLLFSKQIETHLILFLKHMKHMINAIFFNYLILVIRKYLSVAVESWLIKQIISQSHWAAYHSIGHVPFFIIWYLSYFAEFLHHLASNIKLIGFTSFSAQITTQSVIITSHLRTKDILAPLQLNEKDAFNE